MPLVFVKHLFYKALKYEVTESVEAMPLVFVKHLFYKALKYEVTESVEAMPLLLVHIFSTTH